MAWTRYMFWPENVYIDAINDNVYGHLTLCYTLFKWLHLKVS